MSLKEQTALRTQEKNVGGENGKEEKGGIPMLIKKYHAK